MILYGALVLKGEHYYLISMGVLLTGLVGGILVFESGRPGTALLTCIAVFVVVAVLSRIVLAPLPQIKPVAAVVILSGIALGKESGFMCGMLAMFLSNFYFMQGAWTPFQMFAMGLIGYLAGLLFYGKNATTPRLIRVIVYGFFSVLILYGGIVDINTLFFTMGSNPEESGVLTVYLAGLPFDLVFAGATAVFLLLLYRPMMKIWLRILKKYEIGGN